MNYINNQLPTIWTIEFVDGYILHITWLDREGARALAMADRIHKGLPYQVKSQYKREWRDVQPAS